ncbi:MAG TPA: fibronectin type III domain-containing protein [Planctomycetota bacterium]|nr:fibronectin type III domain-containing protein [Planctomycetota bacterium]
MSRSRYAFAAFAALLPLAGTLPGDARADSSPAAKLLGGSGADRIRAVALDPSGACFVAGTTSSDDFPAVNAFQSSRAGQADAFVAKIAADGKTILFATFLGGTGNDDALALAPDGTGGVWVAGVTESSNFPTQNPLQGPAGGVDMFVAHLSANGSALLSSTYLGGTGDDRAAALALDASGGPWIAGSTTSEDAPVNYIEYQYYLRGGADAFVAHLTPDGTTLLQGTYLGGTSDDGVLAMLVEASGSVLLAGRTESTDFPVVSAVQSSHAGGADGFVVRLAGDAASLGFSTFLGGAGDDEVSALASGGSGFACTGTTDSTDFPVLGAISTEPAGGTDAFVASFNSADSIRYWGRFGGMADDRGVAIAQEGGGAVVLAGTTASPDFPVRAAAIGTPIGGTDGFLVRLAPNGSSMTYGTFLGGSGDDEIGAVATTGSGSLLIAGATDSSDFSTGGGEAGATAGGVDGFLARVPTAPPAPTGLGVTAVTHKKVSLAWTDATDGRGSFEVERRAGMGEFLPAASLPAGTVTFEDTQVAPASLYAYRVRSVVEGSPSPYSAEIGAVTLSIPTPTMPGVPAVEATSPHQVVVSWEDRSDDESTFELFRSVDGGASSLYRSLPANTTGFTDAVTADRTWTYRVRAVGVSGASGLTPASSVTTSSTLVVTPMTGKRTDGPRLGRDSVAVLARVLGLEGGAMPDPRTGGIQVGVGAEGGSAILTLSAGTEGWSERNGVLTWKSPRGAVVKAVLKVDTVRGTVRLKASGLELPACDPAAIRVWVRVGAEAGESAAAWQAMKPGRATLVK